MMIIKITKVQTTDQLISLLEPPDIPIRVTSFVEVTNRQPC